MIVFTINPLLLGYTYLMQTDFLPEHLPAWMRQPRRSLDWGIVLAAALGLIVAWAFSIRPGVPIYSNLLHSGFMAYDLADGLREGQLFARWSPHAFSGYGAPIPTFIPQGAPLIAALTDQLFTGDVGSALRLVLTGSLVSAAVTQYLFCRRWIGPPAALLAAALYVFSPILGLTATHVAGDLAGVIGMALLPCSLWAASRSVSNISAWDVPLNAAVFTALLYIHPLLAASGIAIAVVLTVSDGRGALLRLAGSITAAIGLLAPFWLPAITQMDVVSWRSTGQATQISLSPGSLVALPRLIDPILLNPPPQFTLGLLLPAFAGLGLLWVAVSRHSRQFAFIMAGIAALSALGATLSGAPWPTYVLTMACATLGGLALEWRNRLPNVFRRAILPSVLLLLLVASQAVWLSPFGPSTNNFTPSEQIEYEQNGFGVAVLPPGSQVPATIRNGLPPERSLIESYDGQPLIRIRPGTPARVTPISSGTHASTWQVSTTAPALITLSLAYFPSWQATLNGQPLTTERTVSGLLAVELPQSTNGTLRISLDAIPEDSLGWLIALAALTGLAAWVRLSPATKQSSAPLLNVQEVRLTGFALVVAGIALVSAAVPDDTLRLRPDSFISLNDSLPVTAISDPLRLLAYKFDATRASPGDKLGATLYWSSSRQPTVNFGLRLILIDIDRQVQFVLTSLHAPGNLPTRRWLAGYMVYDPYELELPADLTPGTYQLSVEAVPCDNICDLGQPLRFRDSQGVERPAVILPTVLTISD